MRRSYVKGGEQGVSEGGIQTKPRVREERRGVSEE